VFWAVNLKAGDHSEDFGRDGRKNWMWGMDWTDLAQESNMWRALVNIVLNLRVK
jgi:hypothetical protein